VSLLSKKFELLLSKNKLAHKKIYLAASTTALPIGLSLPRRNDFVIKSKMSNFRNLYIRDIQQAYAIKNGKTLDNTDIDTLIQILQDISKMTHAITLEAKIKFILTAKMEPTPQTPYQYDYSLRFNYNEEDLNSLAELIGYIKTLSSILIDSHHSISNFVNSYINGEIQEFVQNVISHPMVHAKSSKDTKVFGLLEQIRNLFGYWAIPGYDPNSKIPKDSKSLKPNEVKPSYISYTVHQIEVICQQFEQILRPVNGYMGKGGLFSSGSFHKKHIEQTQEFINASRMWTYLADYTNHVRAASNLGAIWYTETYLDIDKQLQYPVRSSLPFILAEHLLSKPERVALHDSFLFPFELYNDAAYLALNEFKSQYLYKEIEAEVTLKNIGTFAFKK
jgi:cytoplasmic FMR1 interacting protein